MSFEIFMKTPGMELPPLAPGEFRYVLGRDGLSLERATAMYTSSVKVDGPIPFLDDNPQHCQLHCGPIPSEMLSRMVGFFQAAYQMHGGEAALVLLYYPETGRFAWHCPKQMIRMYLWWNKLHAEDSVEYDNPLTLPEGAVHFGDAHSHLGPPTPSLVDQKDEAHLDGLHIIAGYVNSQRPSYHLDFCIDGHRFKVPTDAIFEAIPEAPFPEPPAEWLNQIRILYPKSYLASKSNTYSTSSYHAKSSFHSNGSAKNEEHADKGEPEVQKDREQSTEEETE